MIEIENSNMAKLIELIDSIKDMRHLIQAYFKKQLKNNDLGITVEMLEVLMVLSRTSKINQKEIADRVRKNKANLTPIIHKLSLKGLLLRKEDPKDRRNNIISLTEKGKNLCSNYNKTFEEFYANFLRDVDVENMNKTISMLKMIGQQVSQID